MLDVLLRLMLSTLYFDISTFRSMCVVPNMTVFCSTLLLLFSRATVRCESWLPLNHPQFPKASEQYLPIFHSHFIDLIFKFVSPSFTWSSSFPCSFHRSYFICFGILLLPLLLLFFKNAII